MSIINILKKDISKSNKKFKLVIYLWLWNALFALIVALPFYFVLKSHFSYSLMGDSLRNGFDFLWLGDIAYKSRSSASFIPMFIIIPAVFYLLSHIFINGGIIGRLNDSEAKVSLSKFFSDCGAFFGRFFRLFLFSIPIYLLVVGGVSFVLSVFFKIFTKNATTEWSSIITGNIKMIFVLLLFSIVNMFFDYVKIQLVKNGRKKVIKEMWFTLKFILKNFFPAWTLYLIIGLLHIIITLIYLEISKLLPAGSTILLLLLVFLWHQIYIIFRNFIKVFFFSSQMAFYDLNDEFVEEEISELTPTDI